MTAGSPVSLDLFERRELPRAATAAPAVAVVLPCYRVAQQAPRVIAAIGPQVQHIFAVDDACPEGSGQHITEQVKDARVRVLRHERNRGVGAATITGYRAALEAGADIVVKIDGDGQMDPRLLPDFIAP